MTTRRGALALISGLPLLAPFASAKAAPSPPGLKDILREPIARGAAMSPNGKRVAVLNQQGEGRELIAYLNLFDADAPETPPKQVVLGAYLVDGLYWANDERLLVSFIVEGVAAYGHKFRRMMSIRADGTDPILMFGDQKSFQRANWDLGRIVSALPGDPDRVLMAVYDYGPALTLHHVDVNTGAATFFERGNTSTVTWSVQNGTPILRLDTNDSGTVTRVMGRAPGESKYALIRKVLRRSEWERPNFEPVGATEEPGVILVVSRADGDPAATVRKYDVRSTEMGEIVAAHPDRDMDGALTDDLGRFVAGRYVEDRTAYVFADPKLSPHFRGMEAFFGNKYSVTLVETNRDHTRFLVVVSGPGVYSAYYLYDSAVAHFQILGLGKPWLDAEALAQVEMLDIKTRDGTVQRAYLTVPNATGPRPLLVMPHGGPEVRDQVTFDTFAQVLAAQGWFVLQPNFRGSGGYGRAFAEAGHGRWGDRMQEDVEDAVAQVLATGRVDRARVAICGASYGGYAALMGAVRQPDLYKAAVSIAGVSDLPRMLSEEKRNDKSEDNVLYNLWVARIGDPETEMGKIQAASPALRAAEIRAPVLLIHGLADGIVPHQQSAYMAAALKREGKAYEHVELTGVGHRYWDEEEMTKIYGKTIDFIAKAFA